jgi:hypothetical protein
LIFILTDVHFGGIENEKPLRFPCYKDSDVVPVAVAFEEEGLRQQLRNMRARSDPQVKLWFVLFRLIRSTPLESRIAAG